MIFLFCLGYSIINESDKQEMIKIIIGLGNPDEKLKNTYHNVGHLFIDFISQKLGFEEIGTKSGKILSLPKTKNPILLKTQAYMNQSGQAIKEIEKKLKVASDKLLIVHDDSDIEVGNWKMSFDRNSAGHKGVESIIRALKTKKFWRLRIGIRPKQNKNEKRLKAGDFVLKPITTAQKNKIYSAFGEAIEKITEKEKP